MFYCDFIHYKNYCDSLTGLKYARINYGHVPNNYENILSVLEEEYISYKVECKDNYKVHRITSKKEVDANVISKDELEMTNKIKDYFKDYSVGDIVKKHMRRRFF